MFYNQPTSGFDVITIKEIIELIEKCSKITIEAKRRLRENKTSPVPDLFEHSA